METQEQFTYNNLERRMFIRLVNNKEKPISALQAAKLLITHTSIKYMKIFPRLDLYYIYSHQMGIYLELRPSEMDVLISDLFKKVDYPPIESSTYLRSVLSNLRVQSSIAFLGEPKFNKEILVMENGALNLETREFTSWSPNYFVVTKLPFAYDPSASCPRFHSFMEQFCNFNDDRILFIRSFLNALIYSRVYLQIFIYILGPGGTGKSTLALIATALVGKESTITTTLKTLHSDQFELTNLRGKKLILLSDTEYYTGDISVLKALVGGDSLRGRIKYVQGSFEVEPEGMVLIVGNYPLGVRDTTNAILRRMRTFPATHVSNDRRPLIVYKSNKWEGPLSGELPGIFNWVLDMDKEQVEDYLINTDRKVVSLGDEVQAINDLINPLGEWVREELQIGKGSYVGFRSTEGPKGFLEMSRRKALYPAYESWVKRRSGRPLSHNHFSLNLISILTSNGFNPVKIRRTAGMFIEGVEVKPSIYERDHIYGAPLSLPSEELQALVDSVVVPETSIKSEVEDRLQSKLQSLNPLSNISDSLENRLQSKLQSLNHLYNSSFPTAENCSEVRDKRNNINNLSNTSEQEMDTEVRNKINRINDLSLTSEQEMNSEVKDKRLQLKRKDLSNISDSFLDENCSLKDLKDSKLPLETLIRLDTDGSKIRQNLQSKSKLEELKLQNKLHPKVHPRLYNDLYSRYYGILDRTKLKESLNSFSRDLFKERKEFLLQSCVDTYCATCQVASPEFRSRLAEVIAKGIKQISIFGSIPYTYKQMGVSPRVLPQMYGKSINNTKKVLRNACYESLGSYVLEQYGMVIMDLDLVSCYTSILLGLFPDDLRSLQYAIEGEGLWNHIKREFESNGRGSVYNKPAVKICTYSSFFLGGNRAMMHGITEAFRKDVGLTEKQFKESSFYEECYQIAQNVTSEMQNSSVIVDLRSISDWIMKTYDGEYLEGPTGHRYLVSEQTFRSAYPNYLISYEFALISQGTLETVSQFDRVEVIGHYHDGNVLLVPIELKDKVIDIMSKKVLEIGRNLGLRYPQKIEVKRIFPELQP